MSAKVDDDAEALPRDLLHGGVQLFAAVAPPGSEGVTGKAFRVNPNQRHMAISAIAVQVPQHQRKVLAARYYVVPVELEGPVRGGQHGRHDSPDSLWFTHPATFT
jgi:hypothetical protein